MPKPFNVQAFYQQHREEIDALGRALAVDFDTPAQAQINRAFSNMGERRFVAGDDRWEQITSAQMGHEYVRPPRRLIQRWASY